MKKLLIGLALISFCSCKKCTECLVTTYVDTTKPQGQISIIKFCGTSKQIKNFEKNSDSQQKINCK